MKYGVDGDGYEHERANSGGHEGGRQSTQLRLITFMYACISPSLPWLVCCRGTRILTSGRASVHLSVCPSTDGRQSNLSHGRANVALYGKQRHLTGCARLGGTRRLIHSLGGGREGKSRSRLDHPAVCRPAIRSGAVQGIYLDNPFRVYWPKPSPGVVKPLCRGPLCLISATGW